METAAKPDRDSPQQGFPARVRNVLAKTRYKTPYGFTTGPKKSGFSKATLNAWFRKRGTRFPVSKALLEFAHLTGASLDYLVFGDGPEFRGQVLPTGDFAEMLRKEVARLLKREGWPLGDLIALDLPDGEIILRGAVKQEWERFRGTFLKRITRDRPVADAAKTQLPGSRKGP